MRLHVGFIPKKIQWHIHTGSWSLVNWWCKALMRHYITGSWILMRMAVGLEEWLGLDSDRCMPDNKTLLTKSSVQVARNHLRYSNSSVTIFCTSGWVQNPPARKMCFAFAMMRESYAVMATWWQNVYTRVRAMSSLLKSAEMNSKKKNNESLYLFIFNFWRTSINFVGPLFIPVLDFWWHLPCLSNPRWISHLNAWWPASNTAKISRKFYENKEIRTRGCPKYVYLDTSLNRTRLLMFTHELCVKFLLTQGFADCLSLKKDWSVSRCNLSPVGIDVVTSVIFTIFCCYHGLLLWYIKVKIVPLLWKLLQLIIVLKN